MSTLTFSSIPVDAAPKVVQALLSVQRTQVIPFLKFTCQSGRRFTQIDVDVPGGFLGPDDTMFRSLLNKGSFQGLENYHRR